MLKLVNNILAFNLNLNWYSKRSRFLNNLTSNFYKMKGKRQFQIPVIIILVNESEILSFLSQQEL